LALIELGFNIITLRGNHEQMFIESEDGFVKFSHFVQFGGDKTLESFEKDFLHELPEQFQKFFNDTKLI
jgi:serine/threonine protein phosphatase 1